MKCKIFIVFLLLLPFSAVLAQTVQPVPVDISTELVKIQGKVFYVHHVLKGQTLYSISRVYGVTQDEIHRYNPQVKGIGLQEGMFLQIPQQAGKTLPATTPTTVTTPAPTTVTVTPAPVIHDTVSMVTAISSEQQPNPNRYKPLDDISETIPTREEQAPIACRYEENLPDINQCEAYMYDPEKTRFQVALLLPLSAQVLLQQSAIDSAGAIARIRSNSDNFIEFYGGALMAVQDMKDKGVVTDISVWDVPDSQALRTLMNSQILNDMDLIVGPIYASSLAELLPYTAKHNISIVSPLDTQSETLLPDYANLFQVPPSLTCQHLKLLSGISSEKDNVILVYEEESEEQALIDVYKSLLSECRFLSLLPYKVVKGTAIRDVINKQLVLDKENRVVVASNNEALVSDLISNLSPLQSRFKYPITLYGQARWRTFEKVDLSYLHALNLRLVASFFIDYTDADVKNFVTRYRLDFNADPSPYAFQGYDVMRYFLTALHRYGPRFGDCISLLQTKLLQGNYQFRRYDPEGGFINTGSSLIRYTPELEIRRE
ncbi:MAG: LysM peptidoglycan-binding domain-containing protein [Bacteroidales bacterium]|nr:LysM peptidoglycan-binding domain-containing protein [Bacteroidales bacterium]MCL2133169.1 LysM peptidoglycan-binding domain-containing protein [Bacteroidales bacterium]